MAKSFASAQQKSIDTGFLDLMGSSKSNYNAPTFDQLANSLAYVASVYTDKLTKELRIKDADSSGSLSDSIVALDVKILGSLYTVEIEANKYADFIDEGVSGWAKDRGSQYKFKTKGVDPNGAMVKSIKAWLLREGNISRNTKKAITPRESRRMNIKDATTKAAISAAYMVKRQGIAPTHFWRDATSQMDDIIRKEFSAALKIDIINNITDN